MILRQFQQLLAEIYDAPVPHDIYDFLVTRPQPAGVARNVSEEELLVARNADGLDVALYVDAGVLGRLAAANPVDELHAGNLADCWTALEGVSHFVYLAFNAHHDREVSRLELETQAEVDKYVVSLWLLRRQRPERFPLELHSLLFQRARVDVRLPRELADLYRAASDYAGRFCRRVERRLRERAVAVAADVTTDLRRFYRLNDARKWSHIERRA